MIRKVFILVPSDSPAGPVKGAYALANALATRREVSLVAVKRGPGAQADLDKRVRHICLADLAPGLLGRLQAYRRLLRDGGGRARVASLSMCLSADAFNLLCRPFAVTGASVRGNLLANYRLDYGRAGVPLAILHLFSLRWHDRVVAMNEPMAKQVRQYAGCEPAVIGNFVDEAALDRWRVAEKGSGPLRFVFVGSLTERKQPWLVVDALAQLREQGVSAIADFIGTGPMQARLLEAASRHALGPSVRLHGFVNQPGALLAGADAMVLPSLSEGTSRAALEAMYLGVPCVLRAADGNAELVQEGCNGALFEKDSDLAAAMHRAAKVGRSRVEHTSLLPAGFRQVPAALHYLELLENIDDPRT